MTAAYADVTLYSWVFEDHGSVSFTTSPDPCGVDLETSAVVALDQFGRFQRWERDDPRWRHVTLGSPDDDIWLQWLLWATDRGR